MNYYVNNYFVEDEKLPETVMPGNFRSEVTLSALDANKQKIKIYQTTWFVTVE